MVLAPINRWRKDLSEETQEDMLTEQESQVGVPQDLVAMFKDFVATTRASYIANPPVSCRSRVPILFDLDDEEVMKNVASMRYRLLQFHENYRPAYWGTWSKGSKLVTGRRPFGQDTTTLDYEEDSEAEWEEEEDGEDLQTEEDMEDADDFSVDEEEDDWLVPDGHLSDDEGLVGENVSETAPTGAPGAVSVSRGKDKNSKQSSHRTNIVTKMVPEIIGPIFDEFLDAPSLNATLNVYCYMSLVEGVVFGIDPFPEDAPVKSKNVAKDVVMEDTEMSGSTTAGNNTNANNNNNNNSNPDANNTKKPATVKKVLSDEDLPEFARMIHLSNKSIKTLVDEAKEKFANVSKAQLEVKIKEIAAKETRLSGKPRWYIKDDVAKELNLELPVETASVPSSAVKATPAITTTSNTLATPKVHPSSKQKSTVKSGRPTIPLIFSSPPPLSTKLFAKAQGDIPVLQTSSPMVSKTVAAPTTISTTDDAATPVKEEPTETQPKLPSKPSLTLLNMYGFLPSLAKESASRKIFDSDWSQNGRLKTETVEYYQSLESTLSSSFLSDSDKCIKLLNEPTAPIVTNIGDTPLPVLMRLFNIVASTQLTNDALKSRCLRLLGNYYQSLVPALGDLVEQQQQQQQGMESEETTTTALNDVRRKWKFLLGQPKFESTLSNCMHISPENNVSKDIVRNALRLLLSIHDMQSVEDSVLSNVVNDFDRKVAHTWIRAFLEIVTDEECCLSVELTTLALRCIIAVLPQFTFGKDEDFWSFVEGLRLRLESWLGESDEWKEAKLLCLKLVNELTALCSYVHKELSQELNLQLVNTVRKFMDVDVDGSMMQVEGEEDEIKVLAAGAFSNLMGKSKAL